MKGVRDPVWKGPCQDGITFSLLSRFLVCRERFRLYVVEGLKDDEGFNHKLAYGNMWHVCEEALAKEQPNRGWTWERAVTSSLGEYCKCLCQKYPTAQDQIDHWYNVCRVQFPIYVNFWRDHPDVMERTPLLQEQVFDVPYALPSGRVVRLRGKWDAVDLVGKGRAAGVYLQENKTKGDVRPEQIQRQLYFDLQTLLYLTALVERRKVGPTTIAGIHPLCGVRYNVVRRPLSGGKGTIVRHKGSKTTPRESREAFYKRVAAYIEKEPEHYFMRFKVEVTPGDVKRFRRECLDPVLENLLDWWDEVKPPAEQPRPVNYTTPMNWRHPFGVWNPLNEGAATDLDEYLHSGSEVGLARVDDLFPELGD